MIVNFFFAVSLSLLILLAHSLTLIKVVVAAAAAAAAVAGAAATDCIDKRKYDSLLRDNLYSTVFKQCVYFATKKKKKNFFKPIQVILTLVHLYPYSYW